MPQCAIGIQREIDSLIARQHPQVIHGFQATYKPMFSKYNPVPQYISAMLPHSRNVKCTN